jgi:threonine dehydrogenase-like Zn-dependent dehydrogenase
MAPSETGRRMGHEFIGVVDAVGADVRTIKRGDLVVAPFVWSDGTCVFCHEGLHTSCLHGGGWGSPNVDGGQGEAVRVPQRVKELTDNLGADSVLECVGYEQSTLTALSIARPGGAVGRVGVPQDEAIPAAVPTFFDNITIAGGPAPVRAYIEELLPDVLDGRIEPGRVLDRVTNLDGVPDGYRAMNEREAIKVMIRF